MNAVLDQYKVNIPEGMSGKWAIEKFEVDSEAAKWERIRAVLNHSGRGVPEGKYTRLMRGSELIMSDTPDEIRDHMRAIRLAKGNVLINGLGLGVVLQAVLRKAEVEHVTVVEISADVIALVATHYETMFGRRLTIVNMDAMDYRPPKNARYGMVWHDIWDNICGDNLAEMSTLHRKYGRRADWQGSWGRDFITK